MAVKVRERKGAWWVFVDYKGRRRAKRVGVGASGKRAALAAAEKLQAKLALGDTSPLEEDRRAPSFQDIAEGWLAKYPKVNSISQTTLENYTSFTRKHLIPFFGTRLVSAITTEVIEDFIVAKRSENGSARFAGRPLSDATLRTGLITLRLILQHAVKAKAIVANPAVGVGRFPRNDEETVDPFTVAELRTILATAQEHDPTVATFFRVWAQTGMRAGEVSSLRWGDLDLARGVAVVQRTYSRGRIGPTKTRRTRAVSLLHPVAEDTPEWRPGATAESRSVLAGVRHLTVQSLDPEAYIFAKANGAPWDSMTVLRAWKRVIRAAKVRYRPPEQLRHTFASTQLSRNAPLLYVQKQGGWRSASVLLRVYARWMPQEYGEVAGQPSATPAQPATAGAEARRLATAS